MPRPSSLTLAKDTIQAAFSNNPKRVYSEAELSGVLLQHQGDWRLAKSTSVQDLISFLQKHGRLNRIELVSERYDRSITRYSWGQPTIEELALSINRRAYLSHASALAAHRLTETNRGSIYLNIEQSAKPHRSGSLSQEAINQAFKRPQRQSKLIYVHGRESIVVVAGKHTKRLGVETVAAPNAPPYSVTSIERTLVDIVVRPDYAGGASEILRVYQAAKGKFNAAKLLAILKQLEHSYPYHQSIGFLLQAAGYSKDDYAPFQSVGLEYDFYLCHNIRQRQYSHDWRLFYPIDLKR